MEFFIPKGVLIIKKLLGNSRVIKKNFKRFMKNQ